MGGRSILVVDNEVDLLSTYARLLWRLGHRVVVADTRQAALDALQAEQFALIIADLRLLEGDGLDIVREARSARTSTTVIVVTGFPSRVSRQQALEAGAAAYVTKPLSVGAFTALVEKALGAPSPSGVSSLQ